MHSSIQLALCDYFVGGDKKIRTDAVYISLLPDDMTEEKLGEYFGSIGVIKVSMLVNKVGKKNLYCRPTKKLEGLT